MVMLKKAKKEKVFVGLSGGVDSSVAAKRLIDDGYDVVGVFIKTWQPEFLACNWEAERLDAMRVAAHLNIPFYTCDAEAAYRDDVALYMIEEYKKGRTPNPDVMCNRHVKFGAFLAYAMAHGASKVATGHYARVVLRDGSYHLLRGVDSAKDQSYFLWTLTQEQLSRALFPVGDTTKPMIRAEAEKRGLPTFKKGDSQGVCFLGEVDMKDFLSHYVTATKGDVLAPDGTVVGTHDGALYYTLGQRHGFSIFTTHTESAAHYVIAKDVAQNTITVATEPRVLRGNTVTLASCNFIQEVPPACMAQFRYRQTPFNVRVTQTGPQSATLTVEDSDIDMPSPGQSCVLYTGDECIGGGIIDAVA